MQSLLKYIFKRGGHIKDHNWQSELIISYRQLSDFRWLFLGKIMHLIMLCYDRSTQFTKDRFSSSWARQGTDDDQQCFKQPINTLRTQRITDVTMSPTMAPHLIWISICVIVALRLVKCSRSLRKDEFKDKVICT